MATATVFGRLGWGGGTETKVIALIVVGALIVIGGVMGFDLIMRLQTVITVVTGVLTVVYIGLVADHIHWHTVSALPSGSFQVFIGALVFMMTGFGLGWVNAAADYSRYLPRRSSSRGVIGIVFSFLLCGFIAVAGKRGSAPTMVLSRAAYGVRGNRLPSAISWLLTVGWETVLTALATMATATVFGRLGWGGGTETKVIALIVVGALIVVEIGRAHV